MPCSQRALSWSPAARAGGKLKQALPASLILAACIVLPLGAWLVRNAWMIGDLTGTAEKTQALGWTRKPLATWWRHPIFTPSGLTEFWTQLMASFWRGEFVWFGERLASGVMDAFYWASSLVFLAVAAASVWRPRKNAAPWEGRVIALSISIFAAGVTFLAMMSMAFDFGSCAYPSQAASVFHVGPPDHGGSRALLPLLYVYGLDRAFARFKSPWPGALVLAGILFFVTVSEVDINSAALSSAYNWFGLWAGKG